MNYESDVHMLHFSGKLKPAHWMFDTASDRGTCEEFVNSTMVNQKRTQQVSVFYTIFSNAIIPLQLP